MKWKVWASNAWGPDPPPAMQNAACPRKTVSSGAGDRDEQPLKPTSKMHKMQCEMIPLLNIYLIDTERKGTELTEAN